MTQAELVDLMAQTVWLIILLASPILIASLVLGLGISIFQAVTQIQEQTLTFVPKIMVSFLVFILAAPWLIDILVNYSETLFNSLVEFAR